MNNSTTNSGSSSQQIPASSAEILNRGSTSLVQNSNSSAGQIDRTKILNTGSVVQGVQNGQFTTESQNQRINQEVRTTIFMLV
jgi:hypothetical protein